MQLVLLIFLFGGLGALLRYYISLIFSAYGVQVGQFVVNITGIINLTNFAKSKGNNMGDIVLRGLEFPWATAFSNALAAIILGFFASALVEKNGLGFFYYIEKQFSLEENVFSHAVIIGFCGSLSTFSTFTRETILLVQRGSTSVALINVLANLVFSVVCFFAGVVLSSWLLKA